MPLFPSFRMSPDLHSWYFCVELILLICGFHLVLFRDLWDLSSFEFLQWCCVSPRRGLITSTSALNIGWIWLNLYSLLWVIKRSSFCVFMKYHIGGDTCCGCKVIESFLSYFVVFKFTFSSFPLWSFFFILSHVFVSVQMDSFYDMYFLVSMTTVGFPFSASKMVMVCPFPESGWLLFLLLWYCFLQWQAVHFTIRPSVTSYTS